MRSRFSRLTTALAIAAMATACSGAASPSPTAGSAAQYTAFRQASEAYLAMDRAAVAAIGAAQLDGDEAAAVDLAKKAVAEYERQRALLAAMTPAECYRVGHAAALAAVDATLAVVRGWAAGELPSDAEAAGFFQRYELKPQWKHTLDSAEVPCGA